MSLTFTDIEYQTMAINAIRDYKRFPFDITDDEIILKYPIAIKLIIQNIKDSLVIDKSVSQEKQGNRDSTFRETLIIIDSNIKIQLGNPYLRMW
jgi:hypothetical protein